MTGLVADLMCLVVFGKPAQQRLLSVQAILGAADRMEMNWTPRVKRAAEIAATVMYLASDVSSGISGQAIVVDGGFFIS